ncbi:MAG: acid protease [Flavobacteriaceae bacterium]|nr:acid protease [Flavobacteriaceae bacterium]
MKFVKKNLSKTNNTFLKDLLNKQQFVKVKLYKIKTQHLICFGSINNVKATFLIDTGASNSCISLENIDVYDLKTEGEKFEASGASDKKMEAILSKECKFKLGRFSMKKQKFVLLDLNHINSLLESQNVKKINGIIGAEFLKATKAIIDYNNLDLFLKI